MRYGRAVMIALRVQTRAIGKGGGGKLQKDETPKRKSLGQREEKIVDTKEGKKSIQRSSI